MSKAITVFTIIVTLLSTIVGAIQFFSVAELPVIRGEYSLLDKTNQGKQLNLLNDIAKNAGRIVYFDQVVVEIAQDSEQEHRWDEYGNDSVKYAFRFEELTSPNMKSKTDVLDKEIINDLLSYYSLPEESRKLLEIMQMTGMSGYNAFIVFNTPESSRNQYSNFQLVQEGFAEIIDGPFQIKDISGGEDISFELTAPYLDTAGIKQVECTKKDWHWVTKKLLCPLF